MGKTKPETLSYWMRFYVNFNFFISVSESFNFFLYIFALIKKSCQFFCKTSELELKLERFCKKSFY